TAQRIQENINRAADVNPVNLLALALLSTPKHAMGESDLLAQIALSKTLLAEVPYGDRVTVTPHTPEQIVAHGEEIGLLTRTTQRIQENINRAADVNPVNLLALALLSTPKHAMGESDLLAQIALSKTLLAEVPYGDRVTVTPHTPEQIVAHGEEIGLLTRTT